jgi:hypothetical protein
MLRFAGVSAVVACVSACGDFSEALNFSSLEFDAKKCRTADDCAAPFACCTGGVAIQAEAGESGDLSPRCLPPDEYCAAYLPHLPAGSPCQRAAPAVDGISRNVIYTGLDDCREGLICCPSTLTCGLAAECPAEPVTPEADGTAPPGGVDGGVPPGESNCSADGDCTGGLLCCGISYTNRAGLCVAPRACGATSFEGGAGGGEADAGVSTPDAAADPCPHPPGAAIPGCDGPMPLAPLPGLVLEFNFEQAAICDASGQAHHGTLTSGSVRVGGPDGSGALDGTVTLPVYAGLNPNGALAVSFYLSRSSDVGFLNLGNDLALLTGGCGEIKAIAAGQLVQTPCGVTPGATWVHVTVSLDATGLTIYVDGRAQVTGAGSVPVEFCGPLELGGQGVLLDQFRWWRRAIGPEEACGLAGRSFAGGVCQ